MLAAGPPAANRISARRPTSHQAAAKSASSCGTAVSNPTTSSIPASSGSAMLNSFDTIPTTTSFAAIPVRSRYCRSAWTG